MLLLRFLQTDTAVKQVPRSTTQLSLVARGGTVKLRGFPAEQPSSELKRIKSNHCVALAIVAEKKNRQRGAHPLPMLGED